MLPELESMHAFTTCEEPDHACITPMFAAAGGGGQLYLGARLAPLDGKEGRRRVALDGEECQSWAWEGSTSGGYKWWHGETRGGVGHGGSTIRGGHTSVGAMAGIPGCAGAGWRRGLA
jgi:hypothetical protein